MESTQVHHHEASNKGKLVGQKAPFKLREIWAIRVRLELQGRLRELVLFDLGIDSKLRACDLLSLRVRDVCHGDRVAARTIVLQQKTQRPVQFEITPPTREVVAAWIRKSGLKADGQLPVPESCPRITALGHTPVRSDRRWVGRGDRAGPDGVRHAFDAPDQTNVDLPPHQEPPRDSALTWPRQGREHSEVPRDRG
jgi:hypothetical protein